MSIFLGIDPGSRITGYGIIKAEGIHCSYIASGCIRLDPKASLPDRLLQIYHDIKEIIKKYDPKEMGIEQVFMSKNADSALKLGQARGAAIVVSMSQGLIVSEYSARQVKQSVTGTGAADKKQVQHMIRAILKLDHTPQADAADALAIAVCHIHTRHNLIRTASKKYSKRRLWNK